MKTVHRRTALAFTMLMDTLTDDLRQCCSPMICSERREQVEESLKRWRYTLERRGRKVSRCKIEYMCLDERETDATEILKL